MTRQPLPTAPMAGAPAPRDSPDPGQGSASRMLLLTRDRKAVVVHRGAERAALRTGFEGLCRPLVLAVPPLSSDKPAQRGLKCLEVLCPFIGGGGGGEGWEAVALPFVNSLHS